MGFWNNLWQDTKRFFSKSCPNCKTNNADLPSDQHIIRNIISQHSRIQTHWRRGNDGKMHPHFHKLWIKHIRYECQRCGHTWERYESSPPFQG